MTNATKLKSNIVLIVAKCNVNETEVIYDGMQLGY